MNVQEILDRLEAVKPMGSGKWTARCPAHKDRNPSLSVGLGETGVLLHCHAGCAHSAVVDGLGLKPRDLFYDADNGKASCIVAKHAYVDEVGATLFEVVRFAPKGFRQRTSDGNGGWIWSVKGVRTVPYRLPAVVDALKSDRAVAVVEGEKDADRLAALGIAATTNAGGASKWKSEHSEHLRGAAVIIIPDNDDAGREHARAVGRSLQGVAKSVHVLELPDLPEKGDISDWLDAGGTEDDLRRLAREAPIWSEWLQDEPVPEPEGGGEQDTPEQPVTFIDFHAYMPDHKYIYEPTRELWPGKSVDARLPKVYAHEKGKEISASAWLDQNRPVEQMTWAPGEPTLIQGRLIAYGGWIDRKGARCFNLYRPPVIEHGDPTKAKLWLKHVHRVYPAEAEHIITCLAHRVQKPAEKINHALVLHGGQGVGKDTIIEGAIPAVGQWNCHEVSPHQLLGRFNGFVKSVILRVSEARDLGDRDRYQLYDHLKVYTAAPPTVLRVDEKNIREYAVPNVCFVIITTNYIDGIYLPADDRRHYVASTELTKEDFTEEYWNDHYKWFINGGYGHIAAYLHELDISDFNPKAPPPKTAAFLAVVNSGRAPEDAELADVLEKLQSPPAITLKEIAAKADPEFAEWLGDRKNRRQIPHRMEAVGYVAAQNDTTEDGRWKVGKKNVRIYANRQLSISDRLAAARKLTQASR